MPILVIGADVDRCPRFAATREVTRWCCIVLSAAALSGGVTHSTATEVPTNVDRNTIGSAIRADANAQSSEPRAPSSLNQLPVPATGRLHVLVSTLSLPIEGNYPQGYSPKWSIVGGQKTLTMRLENFVVSRSRNDEARVTLSIRDLNGEPTLEFGILGSTCMATIAPAGLVVLSAQPTQFQLVNFRRADQGPCSRASKYERSWTGQMALSSNLNGDINLQLVLQTFSDRGALTYRYSVSTVEANQLTPALAAAAVERDAQFAAERAQRDARLAVEREARAKADIEARKLPSADLAELGSNTKAGSKLRVTMKGIDDIGFLVGKTPDGKWQPLATAEWSAGGGPGRADVSIQDSLKTGDNILIFGVHNKVFALGAGKWGFDVTLTSDSQVLWTKAHAAIGGGVGIRYWKAFVVNKSAKGALTLKAASAAQTQTVVEKMEEMNAWLQKDYGTENSVMGLAIEAMVQEMFSGGSRSSDNQQECRNPDTMTDYYGRKMIVGCLDRRR
jgi:hypothetical protein